MQDFRNLRAWQKSHHVALEVYRITTDFPTSERYGLTGQMRRASVSIGSNIAEGATRLSDGDFRRLVGIAMGSASELEYQLLLSKDLGFIDEHPYEHLVVEVQEVKRMLGGLIRSLSNQDCSPPSDSG
jgi:four helix bundle protein